MLTLSIQKSFKVIRGITLVALFAASTSQEASYNYSNSSPDLSFSNDEKLALLITGAAVTIGVCYGGYKLHEHWSFNRDMSDFENCKTAHSTIENNNQFNVPWDQLTTTQDTDLFSW